MIDEGKYYMSLAEIAGVLGITAEGARLVEKRALEKIRKMPNTSILHYYLFD